jgi:hypothetical protein
MLMDVLFFFLIFIVYTTEYVMYSFKLKIYYMY